MNQTEMNELSVLVERRATVRRLLREREDGAVGEPLTAEQREAIRYVLDDKARDDARLEALMHRLADQLERLIRRLGDEAIEGETGGRVRRLREEMQEMGERNRRSGGLSGTATLAEPHTAALVDPYMDDSAPLAHRVGVPEGDL